MMWKYERDGDGLTIGEDIRGELIVIRSWYDSANRRNERPILVPEKERQTAAQALAGDGYRVVPADEAEVQASIVRGACVCCGRGGLMVGAEGHITCSQADCPKPEATDEMLRTPQPDRPAPVEPSEVRVGDVVEIEHIDGDWMVSGRCVAALSGTMLAVVSNDCWIDVGEAVVRILRRAEPEPDPAAVGRLHDAICAISGLGTDDALPMARALIRDHGVHVEVPDA